MSLDSNWAEPKTNSSKDRQAAELYLKTHVRIHFISLRIKMRQIYCKLEKISSYIHYLPKTTSLYVLLTV